MGSEWPLVTLGDVVDLATGFPFESQRYTGEPGDPRLLRGDNVGQGSLRWDGAKRWPAQSTVGLNDYWLRAGDVILAMDRPWIEAGLKYATVLESDLPALLVQRVARLRGTERLDTRFLRYVIAGRDFTDYVTGIQTGTAVPHISGGQIRGYRFPLPPLGEQRRIAGILGALDDKIELNRRMSQTLESMARALFKSWFVDFDPVRAKSEGRASALPSDRADLFPASFDNTAMGQIPKGWRLETIGSIADVVDCSHAKKPERRGNGRPLLQLANIRPDGVLDMSDPFLIDDADYGAWTDRIEASTGDCVITNVGRVGAVAQIPAGVSAALGRNMTAVRCRRDGPHPTFLVEALRSGSMGEEIALKTDAGTILDALNVRSIPRLRLVVPSEGVLVGFEAAARPFRAMMETIEKQRGHLQRLRDELLPRLLSRGLSVPGEARGGVRGRP